MRPQALIEFICEDCGKRFAAWSHIAHLVDPDTKEPIVCPECGSSELKEVDTLIVG